MSLPARISFSQIGIFVSIIVYLVVRGFFVLINIGGPFWTQVGGYLSVAFPLGPVIALGFAACVISYAFSYLGLWMMDKDFFILVNEEIIELPNVRLGARYPDHLWWDLALQIQDPVNIR